MLRVSAIILAVIAILAMPTVLCAADSSAEAPAAQWSGVAPNQAADHPTVDNIATAKDDAVLVVVNGEKISRRDYLDRLEKMTTEVNGQERLVGSLILAALIQEKIEIQLAQKEGVVPTDEQITKRLDAMKAEGMTELQKRAWGEDDLRHVAFVKQLEINLFTRGVTVSDKELQDYYDKNKLKPGITTPGGAEMGLIVTNTKAKTDQVRDLLKVKHEDFAAVAAKYSDLPALRASRGVVGFVPEDIKIIPEDRRPPADLHKALFALKKGEISEPIKNGDSWFTIKMLDCKPKTTRTFEEARASITDAIMAEKAGAKAGAVLRASVSRQMETSEVSIYAQRYSDVWETMKSDAKEASEAAEKEDGKDASSKP